MKSCSVETRSVGRRRTRRNEGFHFATKRKTRVAPPGRFHGMSIQPVTEDLHRASDCSMSIFFTSGPTIFEPYHSRKLGSRRDQRQCPLAPLPVPENLPRSHELLDSTGAGPPLRSTFLMCIAIEVQNARGAE